jgi:hypothetical protein
MARPTLTDLAAGQLAAESTINDNNAVITGGPFPIKQYANFAALPAAGADNVDCLAATEDTDELWISDGSAWRTIGGGHLNANGARGRLVVATTLLSPMAGATMTWAGAFPAGSRAIGVSLRVTTLVTGATSFDVGDGTDVDRYAAAVALAAGTTKTPANATADPGGWRAAAGDVVLTANGSNFTGGAVRVVALYEELTAPTS